jgi:hypothetical protein
MDREDAFDRFDFEQDGLLDNDVGLVTTFQAEAFEHQRAGDFALDLVAVLVQRPAESLIVNGFQQAGAELPMHVYREADYLRG